MQIARFPMKYLTVTQGMNVGTHKGTYAIDLAGKDTGIDNVYAPFDCRIKKIWNYGHTVWIESLYKVKWADGRIAKATMSFTHDNWVADIRVGQVIKQGKAFYQEGTAGYASGNHVHMECAKGSFVGSGWFLNKYGWWTINNKVRPDSLLFLDGTIVKNGGGLNWKRYKKPLAKKKSNETIAKEVLAGKWGNGPTRISRLKKAGYNPTTIQALVNKLLKPTPKPVRVYLIVRAGEGLSSLAKRAKYKDYGKSARWAAIAKLNGSKSWKTFNKNLKPGQKVRLK